MAGDAQTGVTIMRLTEGLDSGPVCLQEATPIGPEENYGELAVRLEEIGARLLVRALDEAPAFAEQDETGVTYAEKITAQDRTLDPPRRRRRSFARCARSRRTSVPGCRSRAKGSSASAPHASGTTAASSCWRSSPRAGGR